MNSPQFKIGDRVIHKLNGEKMTIKRINKTVATLKKDIPEPWTFAGSEQKPITTAVCSIDNLMLLGDE